MDDLYKNNIILVSEIEIAWLVVYFQKLGQHLEKVYIIAIHNGVNIAYFEERFLHYIIILWNLFHYKFQTTKRFK
jgi:uncharacterized membrane protein